MSKLNEAALLWRCIIHQWTGEVTSSEMSDMLADHYQGIRGLMAVTKVKCWEKESYKRISAEISTLRGLIAANTMPWDNFGMKLIPSENYLEFTKLIRTQWSKIEETLKKEFIELWDINLSKLKIQLGKAFKADFYAKGGQQFIDEYKLEIFTFPVPSSQDWRVDIGNEHELEIIKQKTDEFTSKLLKKNKKLKWMELLQYLTLMSTMTLDNPRANFKSSLIPNIHKTATNMLNLRLLDAPEEISMLRECLTTLCKFETKDYKDSLITRRWGVNRSTELIQKIKKWVEDNYAAD